MRLRKWYFGSIEIATALFLSLILASCHSESSNILNNNYKAKLVDSIVVSKDSGSIGEIAITDYDSTKHTYLAYDWRQKEILEFSEKGKVIHNFSITGESPNDCGSDITGICYSGKDSLAITGTKGFFIYNFEGKQLSKVARSGLYPKGLSYKLSMILDFG